MIEIKKKKAGKYLLFSALFLLVVPGILFFFTGCNRLDFVSIGTGAVTGIYYPTGGAICRMINKKMRLYKIKATVEATAGSVYNVNAVLSGDLEFGVVQSDRQYQAFHGLSEWKNKGPQKRLRAVFSIHPESVNLVVSADCGVNHITELKGKRVNIGNPGSGPLQNARDALQAFGLDEKQDITAEYVKAVEAPGLLQDERIDAFFYTVGHPNGNLKEATSGRVRVKFLPLEGPPVAALVEKYPYYTEAVIPHKFYPNAQNEKDIHSFGVRGTLVTCEAVDERIVYAVTKEIFENFEEFKSLHPAYADLTKKGMLAGLSAPIHRGALKYYEESGLIQHINKRLLPPQCKTRAAAKTKPQITQIIKITQIKKNTSTGNFPSGRPGYDNSIRVYEHIPLSERGGPPQAGRGVSSPGKKKGLTLNHSQGGGKK